VLLLLLFSLIYLRFISSAGSEPQSHGSVHFNAVYYTLPKIIRFYSFFTTIYLQLGQSPSVSVLSSLGAGDVFEEGRGGGEIPFFEVWQ